ncbi:PhzF family phenazine biosynthesis protein [Paraburkholderia flagellata]|uniref:PhzF family phenazine biosynthesis protein n=1 Tax=Paraburkholderia flagellata TaxID=2883241 RepID=UPI001F3B66D9|nr:PhzF family phenazine biosynthesis protein [Paraburkholderia flagellata]
MKLRIFQVDAFSSRTLEGNPAAVCPLESWLPDEMLKAIAAENNLAETAYFVGHGGRYQLRWFTPQVEVDLCGHATLATSWVLFNELSVPEDLLQFSTRGGELRVRRAVDQLAMDFPGTMPRPCTPPPALLPALGIERAEVLEARDYVVVVDSEAEIARLAPDFAALRECTKFGVSVTARGEAFDFVSRWFGPKVGVDEDIVTGAAHAWLAPYWASRLGKPILTAQQGGVRKGQVGCEVVGDRVIISGHAATYMAGEIYV